MHFLSNSSAQQADEKINIIGAQHRQMHTTYSDYQSYW